MAESTKLAKVVVRPMSSMFKSSKRTVGYHTRLRVPNSQLV